MSAYLVDNKCVCINVSACSVFGSHYDPGALSFAIGKIFQGVIWCYWQNSSSFFNSLTFEHGLNCFTASLRHARILE